MTCYCQVKIAEEICIYIRQEDASFSLFFFRTVEKATQKNSSNRFSFSF